VDETDIHEQWLKSAQTTFPYWYIIQQIRSDTRMLLTFALPLPYWFAVRMF